MIDYLIRMLQTKDINQLISIFVSIVRNIDVEPLIRITSVVIFTMIVIWLLLVINHRIYEHFSGRRVRTHHLTIRNNGNTRSIFLLRAMDLPNQVALRFRVNGSPMIRVTQTTVSGRKEEPAEQMIPQPGDPVPGAAPSKKKKEDSLIPDLRNPLDTVSGTARTVGVTAGTAASGLGYAATLLPGNSKMLSEGQAALKGIQQTTNDAVNSVGIKVRAFDALKNIFKKLFPSKDKLPSLEQAAADMKTSGLQGIDESEAGGIYLPDSIRSKNFVYEDSVWNANIGKTDADGGTLNYAQSKVLEPGESMKVDLELMNLSDNVNPVSYYYKIEVLQIPMTKLPLSAPRQIINGIVVFPRLSQLESLAPSMIMFGLLVISIQLIAVYSRWIF